MTENLPDEPGAEEQNADEQNADELEQELLDAMRSLRRKNKKVEEYLDGLARTVEKPAEEKSDAPPA
jgi:hypothetical protein